MNEQQMSGEVSGELRAKQRQRRYWTGMIVPALFAIAILQGAKFAMGGQIWDKAGKLDSAFAILASVVVITGTIAGGIWQHRIFDEIEERAVLWANTVAIYFVIAVGFTADLLAFAQIVPAVSHMAIVVAAFVPALAVFFWLRFR